jgi:hypothetical protein
LKTYYIRSNITGNGFNQDFPEGTEPCVSSGWTTNIVNKPEEPQVQVKSDLYDTNIVSSWSANLGYQSYTGDASGGAGSYETTDPHKQEKYKYNWNSYNYGKNFETLAKAIKDSFQSIEGIIGEQIKSQEKTEDMAIKQKVSRRDVFKKNIERAVKSTSIQKNSDHDSADIPTRKDGKSEKYIKRPSAFPDTTVQQLQDKGFMVGISELKKGSKKGTFDKCRTVFFNKEEFVDDVFDGELIHKVDGELIHKVEPDKIGEMPETNVEW